jgi:hypothetical protein
MSYLPHENLLARIAEAKRLLQQLRQESDYFLEQRQEHDDLKQAIEEIEEFVLSGQLSRQDTDELLAKINGDIAAIQQWLREPPFPRK